jgi:3-hydroxyisobutyrate dehydrogenase-like beta-hydroxyacid dehydrogenase
MRHIGFVGLGRMGKHMALNLLKSGAELTVAAAGPGSFAAFEQRGVRATTNLVELARCEIVFLSLPDGEVVKTVLFGEAAIAGPGSRVRVVVDTSTIAHKAVFEIGNELESRGIEFLDAPVSGMEARAADGTLTVMCGGKPATFAAIEPYFQCLATKILYMGGPGNGQLAKLVNQLLFNINVAALAEILPMAVKMGLDPAKVAEIVNSGTGRSYASEFFLPRILENGFSAGYPMAKAYKDLVSAAEIGSTHCIPMPVLNAAATTYQMALLRGDGDLDKGGMIRVFEALLGVSYRSVPVPSPVA